MATREAIVKAAARRLGFDAVGITHVGPLGESDPEAALPGARSVLCVALAYSHADSGSIEPGLRGGIARFAQGADYHRVLTEKLTRLIGTIEDELKLPVRFITSADNGPLLDRRAALRAGIGWQGKNTCVYVKDLGSWVVLGELVMDLDLESDPPSEGHRCGGCTQCHEACPTGALTPFALDSSRCISHLTQMIGSVPHELRPLVGTSIFGCDICQQACPHNQRSRLGNHPEFDPALGPGATLDLLELVEISPSMFKRTFDHTAIGTIGRRRLRRNALIALGNLADPVAIPALRKIAHGPDALLREHAEWALGKVLGC